MGLFSTKKYFYHFFLLLLCLTVLMLNGCASSEATRAAASSVDNTYVGTKYFIDNASDSSIGELYQNTNQRTKGALIGGTVGGVAGSVIPGVGIVPGAATGAILGASYGAYIDSTMTLEDQLENRGVNTIILGDQIMIVIPSARLFQTMTSNLKNEAVSTLQLVTIFINRYAKMLVKVSGYTDDSGSPVIDCALSQEQAERVARTLDKSGINARLLYATGLGGTHLVSPNTMNWDSDNYRIEITFTKLYV